MNPLNQFVQNQFNRWIKTAVDNNLPKNIDSSLKPLTIRQTVPRMIQVEYGIEELKLCELNKARLDPVVSQCIRTIKSLVLKVDFKIDIKVLQPTLLKYLHSHQIKETIPYIIEELLGNSGNMLAHWNTELAQLEYYSFWENRINTVQVIRNQHTKEIMGYEVHLGSLNKKRILDPRNCFWLKSSSSYCGVSPLLVALLSTSTKISSQKALHLMADGNYTNKVIITPDSASMSNELEFADKSRGTILTRYSNQLATISKSLKEFIKSPFTFLALETPLKVDNIGKNVQINQITENIKLQDGQTIIAFGLTPVYIGYEQKFGSKARSESETDAIAESTIVEYLQIIADFIDWFLTLTQSAYTNYNGKITFDSPLTDKILKQKEQALETLKLYVENKEVIETSGYTLNTEQFKLLGFSKKENIEQKNNPAT